MTAKGWPKREKVIPYRLATDQYVLAALRKAIGEMIAQEHQQWQQLAQRMAAGKHDTDNTCA